MKFKKGDIVTVSFPSGFKSKYIREKYEGTVHEIVGINYDGWVKLDECDPPINWWPPNFIVKSTVEEDEEIELQDLLSIM